MIKLANSIEELIQLVPEGQTNLISFNGKKYCIVNFRNDLRVFENSCPHLGEDLHKGSLNVHGEIVCPWHSYRFNVKSGECVSHKSKDLEIKSIQIRANGVYLV